MTNHDLIHQQARTIARQQQRIAQLTGGTMQPSDLDMPPLEARPSLAERVATLEEVIKNLEARLCALEDDGWQPEETMYDLEV